MIRRLRFFLIMVYGLTLSSYAEVDKEYASILRDLDSMRYPLIIKKLEVYHSKGKENAESLLLLGHLYSKNNQYEKAISTYLKTNQSERDFKFWINVLDTLNMELQMTKKIESKDKIGLVVLGLKNSLMKYDKNTVKRLTTILKYNQKKEDSEKFCDDLIKKNKKKCELL